MYQKIMTLFLLFIRTCTSYRVQQIGALIQICQLYRINRNACNKWMRVRFFFTEPCFFIVLFHCSLRLRVIWSETRIFCTSTNHQLITTRHKIINIWINNGHFLVKFMSFSLLSLMLLGLILQ